MVSHTLKGNLYSKANGYNIDVEIGKKIKELRLTHGMSQDDLGKKIGITFQQIQKYEKGANRILVSRLCELAKVLSVSIMYFFPSQTKLDKSSSLREGNVNFNYDYDSQDAESKEVLVLVREYNKIKDKEARRAVYSLIKYLSGL
ncbi:helix-turn-helix domain-containing protein [Wolbachia endosymbiont of Pentidionis agamae]|uniref:helix-turn-helix domain-containing protein n=1 Tax=Wolbachia endosymbiont of Pentidionis agamae TaxID=3110435 RepID=UPI002FD14284